MYIFKKTLMRGVNTTEHIDVIGGMLEGLISSYTRIVLLKCMLKVYIIHNKSYIIMY